LNDRKGSVNFPDQTHASVKQLMFFLLLLLCPLLIFSQTNWAVFDTLPAGVVRIDLPATKSANSFNGDAQVITDDATYRSLFADSVQAKLPVIDFTRYELLSKTYCSQCLTVCGNHPQCHRNACRYTRMWFLMDKQDRVALHPGTLNAENCYAFRDLQRGMVCTDDSCFGELQQNCRGLKNDTINFDESVVLARTAFVDCTADIAHDLYLDTVNHCVVWRIHVSDGGCRGMEERSFVFEVPKFPAGYVVLFEAVQKFCD
jgi:hypothetical protein